MKSSKPTFKRIIKEDLIKQGREDIFKKIISVRYSTFSMGCALDVKAKNLSKSQRLFLEKLLQEYQSGHFNSMEDIYEYNRNPSKPRTAKFVSLSNDFSEDIRNSVKMNLEKMGITDNQTAMQKLNRWFDEAMWRELNELENI